MPIKQATLTGSALKRLREAKGIKASWVAAELRMSKQYLCMLESDARTWTPLMIRRYMKAIGE